MGHFILRIMENIIIFKQVVEFPNIYQFQKDNFEQKLSIKKERRKNYSRTYTNNPGITYKLSQVGVGEREIDYQDLKAIMEMDTLEIAILLNEG